jgi:hypothetical protein
LHLLLAGSLPRQGLVFLPQSAHPHDPGSAVAEASLDIICEELLLLADELEKREVVFPLKQVLQMLFSTLLMEYALSRSFL